MKRVESGYSYFHPNHCGSLTQLKIPEACHQDSLVGHDGKEEDKIR